MGVMLDVSFGAFSWLRHTLPPPPKCYPLASVVALEPALGKHSVREETGKAQVAVQ